jgi:hypothetical protein
VVYHASTWGHDGSTHQLDLIRMSNDGAQNTLVSFQCQAPDWKTWHYKADDTTTKVYLTDAEMIVDSLVHCIDRTSGREAIHDPETDHTLAEEYTQFLQLPSSKWRMRQGMEVDAEWTARELKRRKIAKYKAKIYRPGQIAAEVQIPC